MIHRATGGAMVVAGKVGGVTVDAFTRAVQGRPLEGAAGRAVAGGTLAGGMDLADRHKRCRRGVMAANAMDAVRGGGGVLLDGIGVAVVMAAEVIGMTGRTFAAIAAVGRSVAVAVYAIDPGAIGARVAHEAGVAVDPADGVPQMTGDAQGGGGDGQGMVMSVAMIGGVGVGEVVDPMTADTL